MTTSNKPTTTTTTQGSPKRRRRAVHLIVASTDAGDHAMCGEFIARHESTPVKVARNGTPLSIEYYECPACRAMKQLENEMRDYWPRFMVDADMALDMADRWEVKE